MFWNPLTTERLNNIDINKEVIHLFTATAESEFFLKKNLNWCLSSKASKGAM